MCRSRFIASWSGWNRRDLPAILSAAQCATGWQAESRMIMICARQLHRNKRNGFFSDLHVIETGLKHGTVTIVMDGEPIEITTFRTEGAYSDGRSTDSVAFVTDITQDLARRDFTVNAMAWSPRRGLCDPFGRKRGFGTETHSLCRRCGDAVSGGCPGAFCGHFDLHRPEDMK